MKITKELLHQNNILLDRWSEGIAKDARSEAISRTLEIIDFNIFGGALAGMVIMVKHCFISLISTLIC
jgi:hypothetical protein